MSLAHLPYHELAKGAVIVAPATLFSGGVPQGAFVVMPLSGASTPLQAQLAGGPLALNVERLWSLLGLNGPVAYITDEQGRPVAIGLHDLADSLQKRWDEAPKDLDRARVLAKTWFDYERFEQAAAVLAKLVSAEACGEDWMILGLAELQQQKLDAATAALSRAQDLMPQNPMPALYLARVAHLCGDRKTEQSMIVRALGIDGDSVEAWASLFMLVRETDGEAKAIAAVERLARQPAHQKTVAPYVALYGCYAMDEKTRGKALSWAKRAYARDADDPLALTCLSGAYGRLGDHEAVVKLLKPHEAKMAHDVRLTNNYFGALTALRKIDDITRLLGMLGASPHRELRELAVSLSRHTALLLESEQQQVLAAAPPGSVATLACSDGVNPPHEA